MSYINVPSKREKIFCAVFYLSVFMPILFFFPVIYLVVLNVRKMYMSDFLKYHLYQSILFSMVIFFLPDLVFAIFRFLSTFLSLFAVFDNSIALMGGVITWIAKIYAIAIQVLSLYAFIWTLRGKFTYIPAISRAIDSMLRF